MKRLTVGRMGVSAMLAVLGVLLPCAPGSAAPPQLAVSPRGIQRGKPVTLILSGEGVGRANAEVLTSLPGTLGAVTVDHPNRLSVPIIVPASASVGYYPVQLRTDDGLSGRVLIAVGDRPEALEQEPNDEPANAQKITLPATINASCSGSDRDGYRFTAKKGLAVTIEVEARRLGSGLDPALTVFDASGAEVASDSDAIALQLGDRRLTFQVPADGEYVALLNDVRYSGGGDPMYRLKFSVGACVQEVFPLGWRRCETVDLAFWSQDHSGAIKKSWQAPNDPGLAWSLVSPPGEASGGPFRILLGDNPEQLEPESKPESKTPKSWSFGSVMNGRIGAPGEVDAYQIAVTPGQSLVFEVNAAKLGSNLDGVLRVAVPNGSVLGEADDGDGPDPTVGLTVPAGVNELIVSVWDLIRGGGLGYGYRLKTRSVTPDYAIMVRSSAITIPTTGLVVVPVRAQRRNFNDAIQLSIPAETRGVAASGGLIPAGAVEGNLVLRTAGNAQPSLVSLVIWGSSGSPAQPNRRQARLEGDGTPLPPQRPFDLVAAIGQGPPVSLAVVEPSIAFVHGQPARLTVNAQRINGFNEPIAISTLGLPPGVSGGAGKIDPGKNQVNIDFKVDPISGLAAASIQIVAKTNVSGREETIVLPAIPGQVRRPYSFELLTPTITVVQGAKASAVGLVKRVPPFNIEVRLASEGSVPPGLQVQPLHLPPGASVAQIELTTRPETPVGTFDVLLRAATDIEGRKQTKDYIVPDVTLKVTVTAPPPPPKAEQPKAEQPKAARTADSLNSIATRTDPRPQSFIAPIPTAGIDR